MTDTETRCWLRPCLTRGKESWCEQGVLDDTGGQLLEDVVVVLLRRWWWGLLGRLGRAAATAMR